MDVDPSERTYMFYPFRRDGGSVALEMRVCATAASAKDHAEEVLARHRSALYVEIWGAETLVGTVTRLKSA